MGKSTEKVIAEVLRKAKLKFPIKVYGGTDITAYEGLKRRIRIDEGKGKVYFCGQWLTDSLVQLVLKELNEEE